MFGIDVSSTEYQWLLYIIVGIIVFLWVYCILWVAKDISQRTNHFGLQLLSILLIVILTPVLGLPIYFLIRPVGYDMNNYHLQQALLADAVVCINCNEPNSPEHAFCVYCGCKLKIVCKGCKKAYACSYEFCPFCGGPNIDSSVE